jgi:hypothetical protein
MTELSYIGRIAGVSHQITSDNPYAQLTQLRVRNENVEYLKKLDEAAKQRGFATLQTHVWHQSGPGSNEDSQYGYDGYGDGGNGD